MKIDQLRELLKGLTWRAFSQGIFGDPKAGVRVRKGINFHGRVGIFLNQPVAVIIADGKFVVIRPMTKFWDVADNKKTILNPHNALSGHPLCYRNSSQKDGETNCGFSLDEPIIAKADHEDLIKVNRRG